MPAAPAATMAPLMTSISVRACPRRLEHEALAPTPRASMPVMVSQLLLIEDYALGRRHRSYLDSSRA